MVSQCPQCKSELQFTGAQQAKIQKALNELLPGQVIRLGCPHCKSSIELKKEKAVLEGKDAFDLFPDLMKNDSIKVQKVSPPPKPPDISWLNTGSLGEKPQSPDDASILILMPDGEGKSAVSEAFKRLDYRIEYAGSLAETMEKMVSLTFAGVVMHTGFEGVPLAESQIHDYMKWLPMPKRRNINYILIGPDFQTLYDLEALSLSANMVINEKDIGYIYKILRKGISDYEKLFHPFLEVLQK